MRFIFITICIAFVFVTCNNYPDYQPNEDLPRLRAELEDQLNKWNNLNIKDYQFIYHDYNNNPAKVTIMDGVFHAGVIHGGPGGEYYPTFDELFLTISRGFDSDEGPHHPEVVGTNFSVNYHPEYHFPVSYSILYVMATSGWGGNLWSFEVSGFLRLEDVEEETWQPNENMPMLLAEWESNLTAWDNLKILNYQFDIKELLNPDNYVYNEYRTRLIVKNGNGDQSIGLYPSGYGGGATWTMYNIFNNFVYPKFLMEIYYGWDYYPKIGMYFEIEYHPEYHFPVYFEYGYINDPNWFHPGKVFVKSISISNFKINN